MLIKSVYLKDILEKSSDSIENNLFFQSNIWCIKNRLEFVFP
jgi:hypothetical protein